MIDPKKYGTPTEIANLVGVPRTTLIDSAKRGALEHAYTIGGSMLIQVADAKKLAKVERKPGRPKH